MLAADDGAAGNHVKVRLDLAALELARIQYPELEDQPFLDRLNELAARLGDRLRNFNDGRDFVETAQRYLFQELGFHGNEEDYHNPLNSCLNQVLERRTGIPVTLSVMYMEIARRLHMPVFGIGLPRHFILQFDDGNYATYIDPFHGGRTITARECFLLAGAQVPDLNMLRRVSKKQIVMRMLQFMRGAYSRLKDWPRTVETLDMLIAGFSSAPADRVELAPAHKLRGLLRLELKRYQAARADLEQYLNLQPDAPDRPEIVKQIEGIHRWLARMN
ncbi:MAG TPA: transglutaminase-like domain-containing protein [Bryobacteraceae bacterium]|nr:transglutaminase-like domain-containing protein [Bryobacteraceae bacterium]